MLNLIQPIYIETERLIIKNPSMDDFPEVLKMKCNREVMKFTGGATKLSCEQEMSNYFKKINNFGLNNNYVFSVIEKKSNKYIGYCGFKYCDIINNIEILYGFTKSSWGNGYCKEAAKKVLPYGFDNLEFEEISAAVNPKNAASEHIINCIGLKYIGKIDWPNQGQVNLYSLKREEYQKR